MNERPILMNGDMVRALLDGRKTQTRRPLRRDISGRVGRSGRSWHLDDPACVNACPFGQPGDRLWVRETHGFCPRHMGVDRWSYTPEEARAIYAADGVPKLSGPRGFWSPKMRPSIHMPRWACRIVLEIVDVRVQRLRDITGEEAKAEGLRGVTKDGARVKWGIPDADGLPGTDDYGWPWREWSADPRQAFRKIWDDCYAKRGNGWDANPWVWVVEFRRVEA